MADTKPFPTSASMAGTSASDASISDINSMSSSTPGTGKLDATGATLHSKVDQVSSAAHDTVDRLTASVSGIADKLSAKTSTLPKSPQQALDMSSQWVKDKPMAAIGIALAVGYLLGRKRSKTTYYY